MPSDQIDLVRRLFAAFNERDADTVRELWAEDAEWRPAYLGGGLVEGAVYRGHAGMADFLEIQAETWESAVAVAADIWEQGNRVLVESRLQAVGRTSGIELDRVTWNVFELRAGKITDGRVYISRDEALEAMGSPEP